MKQLKVMLYSALLVCAFQPALAVAQPATNRATELRTAPDDSSAVIKLLADKTIVQVLERRGVWSRAKVANDVGWVRMMHLRGGVTIAPAEKSATDAWMAKMERLVVGAPAAKGASSQRAQAATIGIRGFSKEDVQRAELNPQEFEKLKRFQASDVAARRLASEQRLAFRGVAYLARDAVEAVNK